MLEISHLIVNGCSWTYGAGLNAPEKECWPNIVSEKLNIPLINLAIGGSGNDSIYRRTIEYLFKNRSYNSKPLVVIAWSQITRREGWISKKSRYEDIHIGPGNDDVSKMNYHQLAHLYEYDMIEHCRRNLIYKSTMKSFLKNWNLPYLHGNYSDHDVISYNNEGLSVREEFNEMYQYIVEDDYFWKIGLNSTVLSLPKLPCGHETKEGHIVLADYMINLINETFGKIKIVQQDYLKLNNFKNM